MFNAKKIDDIFSNNVNFETDLTFMEMKKKYDSREKSRHIGEMMYNYFSFNHAL